MWSPNGRLNCAKRSAPWSTSAKTRPCSPLPSSPLFRISLSAELLYTWRCMAIKLYNSLGKSLETFAPLKEGELRMYSCGPTVYDYVHIGNLRSFVLSDIVRRLFEYEGYAVT